MNQNEPTKLTLTTSQTLTKDGLMIRMTEIARTLEGQRLEDFQTVSLTLAQVGAKALSHITDERDALTVTQYLSEAGAIAEYTRLMFDRAAAHIKMLEEQLVEKVEPTNANVVSDEEEEAQLAQEMQAE